MMSAINRWWAVRRALRNCSLPLQTRWTLANQPQMPRDGWHSFDRTPWKHPWMTASNIRAFSDYSRSEIERLSHLVEAKSLRAGRYAFAGNMANINYTRAAPLRRHGLDIDLILHPNDKYIFSQPGWEDFDGSIAELGTAPEAALEKRGLPSWVFRYDLDANWQQNIHRYKVATPERILLWTQYMPFLPMFEASSKYDALLVSQFPYLGLLSDRPYLFGQMGGEIWFEAARNDEIGIITRRGIEKAYATLVSNPITFAHARRYGLRNLLYLPWILDEEMYQPADAQAIGAEWVRDIGGNFFVLTSMRIDELWKGSQHALDGFAKFAAKVPDARLVVLSWVTIGSGESNAKRARFDRSCARSPGRWKTQASEVFASGGCRRRAVCTRLLWWVRPGSYGVRNAGDYAP